jgi:hypothetical protein
MTKREVLAYCAGFIDGDGTMFICAAKQSGGAGYYFRPTLAAVGINRRPLDRIAGVFGGEVKPADNLLRCALHYGKATSAAKKLEPFLLVKRHQATLLDAFQRHVDKNRIGGRSRLSPEVLSAKFKFVADMKEMNHRILPATEFRSHTRKRDIAAYVAGLLEAEGYFSIGSSGGNPVISITVAMTDPNVIYWLKDQFGGWAGVLKGRTKAGKLIYVWRPIRYNAYAVAKTVRPYLTFKKEQADILIQYQNNVKLWKRRLGGSVNQFNLPDRVREQREQMKARLKSLHGRAGATTNPEQLPIEEVSDSLDCSDDKAAERSRNENAVLVSA